MIKQRALKPFTYRNKKIEAGEEFECPEQHGRINVGLKRAENIEASKSRNRRGGPKRRTANTNDSGAEPISDDEKSSDQSNTSTPVQTDLIVDNGSPAADDETTMENSSASDDHGLASE